MNNVFPEVQFENWPQCDRLLPQSQHCTSFIMTNSIQIPEAPSLLNKTANYLHERARYSEAEPLYQRALAIREQALGPTHQGVANTLNDLGELVREKEEFEEAKNLFQRSLRIFEQTLGREHPRTEKVRENYEGLLEKMGEGGKER